MKIMYVDNSVDGHHLEYLRQLSSNTQYESIAVLPKKVDSLGIEQIAYSNLDFKRKRLSDYLKYMRTIKTIAGEYQPDVIHFLDGDTAMRYFDVGYRYLKKYRTVVTFHHLFPGKLREMSVKRILKQVSMAVVHTDEIAEVFRGYGCKNVCCIHYPCFMPLQRQKMAKKPYKTLLALGGTRFDKGLDLLLEALKDVSGAFKLVIAGKEESFDSAMIDQMTQSYADKVEKTLRFLTEEEVKFYLENADIIVLPYRKEFDGASGPMCEGAYLEKMIIGPDHGSLGKIIRTNHLGLTFKSEDVHALADVIEHALQMEFVYDEVAKDYQKTLNPEAFLEKYEKLYQRL